MFVILMLLVSPSTWRILQNPALCAKKKLEVESEDLESSLDFTIS